MGMFDRYIPDPPLTCPLDGKLLGRDADGESWQGKSGPCALRTYRQGFGRAVRPFDAPETSWTEIEPDELPERFELHAVCSDDHMLTAEGRLMDGAWVETELLYAVAWRAGDVDTLLWGRRPDVPLWPYDACAQLEARLAGLPGVQIVEFLRANRGLRVVLTGLATDATRAAIPPTFFGHPVEIEQLP